MAGSSEITQSRMVGVVPVGTTVHTVRVKTRIARIGAQWGKIIIIIPTPHLQTNEQTK